MRSALLAAAVSTIVLSAGSAVADDIFMIGSKYDGRAELFDNQVPNGILLTGCPGGDGTFVYGVNTDSDFPGFFETPDISAGFWNAYSCQSVNIQFSIDQACINGSLNYGRYGGELIDLYFNENLVRDNTQAAENVFDEFLTPIEGLLLPGEYSVELQADSKGTGDGYAANDYVQFSCDPLFGYAKVSGRIDDPFVTQGRGAPLATFNGMAGKTLLGEVVGSIEINYKNFNGVVGEVCTVAPENGSDVDFSTPGKAMLKDWRNSCDNALVWIAIYDKSWAPTAYCANQVARGCFGVSDPTGGDLTYRYRVSESLAFGSQPFGYSANIDAGNGIVVKY